MAGSRRENIGSILSRMTGLLKSGAIKPEDRPIWYDVVKALPPKPLPPQQEILKIIYPEDFVRVHFYKTFVETSPAMLTNRKIKSLSQRFVDTYLELHLKKTVPTRDLFDKTVDLLKEGGVTFQTHQEKQEADKARRQSILKHTDKHSTSEESVTESFGQADVSPERGHPKFKGHEKPVVDLDSLLRDDK